MAQMQPPGAPGRGNGPHQAPPPPAAAAVQLVITFTPTTGRVDLQGPLHEPVFCLGLLRLAEEAVLRLQREGISAVGSGAIALPQRR